MQRIRRRWAGTSCQSDVWGPRRAADLERGSSSRDGPTEASCERPSSCCLLQAPVSQVYAVVRVDDFPCVGPWAELEPPHGSLKKLRLEEHDGQSWVCEVKCLNRVVRVSEEGVGWESDPKHLENLIAGYGMQRRGMARTPLTKDGVFQGTTELGPRKDEECPKAHSHPELRSAGSAESLRGRAYPAPTDAMPDRGHGGGSQACGSLLTEVCERRIEIRWRRGTRIGSSVDRQWLGR